MTELVNTYLRYYNWALMLPLFTCLNLKLTWTPPSSPMKNFLDFGYANILHRNFLRFTPPPPDERGPVLEAIVARTLRQIESTGGIWSLSPQFWAFFYFFVAKILLPPPLHFSPPFFLLYVQSTGRKWKRPLIVYKNQYHYSHFTPRTPEWWDVVLQKRLAWPSFVFFLFSTLACCQPKELIWAFCFIIFHFHPPPQARTFAWLACQLRCQTTMTLRSSSALTPITASSISTPLTGEGGKLGVGRDWWWWWWW